MNNLLTDSFELPRHDSSRDGDIEMGMHQADASDNLKDFLKKVDAIESLIAKLTYLLNKLQTANEESKAVTKASAMKSIKQRMEKDIDEVGKIARTAKTKVDELEKDNLSNRQKPGCGKGSAVDRSREQTTGAVKKKLKERMDDFQTIFYFLQPSICAGNEMEPMNVSRKRMYADFSGQPVVTRFKNFDDLELWDVYRAWSIVVRVDVKFHVEDHGDLQRFILMDTTG